MCYEISFYVNGQVEHISYLEACGRSGAGSESQMNSATCVELSSKVTRAQCHGSLKVEVQDESNAKTDYLSDKNGAINITAQTDRIAIKVFFVIE